MTTSRLSYFAITMLAASSLLAGCGGSANVAPSMPVQGASAVALTAPITGARITMPQGVALPSGRRSWMAPDAGKQQLLYVSDLQALVVYVYSYPFFGLLGTLADFKLPRGLCVDAAGDVFVTDQLASDIREYAHGSIVAKATIKDPGYLPVDCAIDPTTGNLAVTNVVATTGSDPGNVAVYKGTSGNPVAYYSAPSLFRPYFLGYDSKGNLFVDGQSSGSAFDMAQLVKGKKTLSHVSLNQSIGVAGGVQWDGKYLAVGDLTAEFIYRFVITGNKGTKIGTVPLTGAGEVEQFTIQSPKVVGPDNINHDVGIWKYPSGGTAVKTLTGLGDPFGSTISKINT